MQVHTSRQLHTTPTPSQELIDIYGEISFYLAEDTSSPTVKGRRPASPSRKEVRNGSGLMQVSRARSPGFR